MTQLFTPKLWIGMKMVNTSCLLRVPTKTVCEQEVLVRATEPKVVQEAVAEAEAKAKQEPTEKAKREKAKEKEKERDGQR